MTGSLPAPEWFAAAPTWLEDAPLFQAWRRFVDADLAPFTIPGHKRRGHRLDPDLGRLLAADVPLYGGLDTMKLTGGVLADAQHRAAALWGADLCRFSTGGSTQANLAIVLALGRPGDQVLVARNAHRSVLSGLVLAGLRPVWLPVRIDPATGGPSGLEVAEVRDALAAHPDAVALLCTEPSYQGTLSDLPALVSMAHRRGVPVVVDQAWGAHLGLAPGYPPHALAMGADAMITSAHKALPAISGGSLLLARTERLDAARIDRAFEATHTTSPPGAVLASIDAARALLASPTGTAALGALRALVAAAREQLRAAGLHVTGPDEHPAGRFDPAKVVIRFATSGRSGLVAEQCLLAADVPVEMADRDTLVAQFGLLDDADTVARLVGGVLATLTGPSGPPRAPMAAGPPLPPIVVAPRAAFFAEYETVARTASIGRVAAELVAPYPPGVPLIVPGELITGPTLAALDAALAAGNRIAYAADPTLATLQVIAGEVLDC
ncbi:MAG: aminotransferase class V-fold PLP-dependent enzyme [Candidatus Nanopelagicales bacterium]